MNEDRYSTLKGTEERIAHRNSDDQYQYLLNTEERILQSISARAPLPELLNAICSALDCQIGSVVSNISLPEDDANELAAVAGDAAFFGLFAFFSAGIVAESGELLGSLEMYCCFLRGPSANELQLIERATCLAGIAIQRDNDSGKPRTRGVSEDRLLREAILDPPASLN